MRVQISLESAETAISHHLGDQQLSNQSKRGNRELGVELGTTVPDENWDARRTESAAKEKILSRIVQRKLILFARNVHTRVVCHLIEGNSIMESSIGSDKVLMRLLSTKLPLSWGFFFVSER